MTKYNILENWYKEVLYLSSMIISNSPKYVRNEVEFIYNIFIEYFPDSFFYIDSTNDNDLEKESWILGLLANYDNSVCVDELNDIAALIDYSKGLDNDIQTYMKSLLKDARGFRDFFFELYIYKKLDDAGIPNYKKLLSGQQEIEGIIEHNGTQYLFECRKTYYPGLNKLFLYNSIAKYFLKSTKKYCNKDIGYIATVTIKSGFDGRLKEKIKNRIISFLKDYYAQDSHKHESFSIEDEDCVFKVMPFTVDNIIETKMKNDCDVLFEFNGKASNWEINFTVNQKKVFEKFKSILKEKQKQHKRSEYINKILFIDSESHPQFHMGLFQTETSYNQEKIRRLYDEYCSDWIVCVLRRDSLKKVPQLTIDFFHQEHHKDTVAFLYSAFKHKQ